MASGYISNGVDLDAIFQPRGSATPVANTGYKVAGVDLAQRYAPRTTSPVPATGFKTAGVDLNQIFNGAITGVVGGFIVYPSATAAAALANTLPWRIGGTLYSSYPAGLLFDSGTIVEMTCPVDAAPASTTGIFGLVALTGTVSSGGTPLSPSLQPTSWSTTSDATFLSVATITSLLPDSGPPYYAGAQYTTAQNTANLKTFTAMTQQGIPVAVTATIDIRTPGYQYTFINYSATNQTVSGGLAFLYGTVPLPVTGILESAFLHGTASSTSGSVTTTFTQLWPYSALGALSSSMYTSIGAVLDTAPNIKYSTNTDLLSSTIANSPGTTSSAHAQINSYNTSSDVVGGNVNESVISVIDANNATITFNTIKSSTISGVNAGTPYSVSGVGEVSPYVNLVFYPFNGGNSGWYLGPGIVAMNRLRVLVT